MIGILGVVLGVMAALAAGTVAVIVGQARRVQRIVPVAMQPPPRAEGLIGARLPGPPLTMTILGDSFAAGYGATRPRETLGVLLGTAVARRAGRPVRLHRQAFVGAMSSDLPHQVQAAVKHEPDIAIIFVGGNDVTRFAPLKAAARHLGEAVGRLRAAGCPVIVGTCPDLGVLPPLRPPLRWLAALRSRWLAHAQTDAVVAAGGFPIPLAELLNPYFEADPVRMFGADRFHPSPAGYARAAAVSLPPLLAALRAEGVIPVPGPGPAVSGCSVVRR
ncbi:putative GDSL-like lipase/acylhydrolase [Actinoplanes missouriensis 431]|uniref:Putative GDSL-like lipase/acylhydrolase n=2 Tax=Actinoplanes missouriensis TaxID=1866 RepID=I0HJK1_ACTM4|nr:putative GDSL-like lipase/acylhydrolase [Actinoplanes missouriensis 431]